jgi:hypothetical protein
MACQTLVTHTCNPSYSGGRDQEDHSSKPVPANSSVRPYLEKPITKWAGGVAEGVGPEFKPQHLKKKNKKKKKKKGIVWTFSYVNSYISRINPSCLYLFGKSFLWIFLPLFVRNIGL